MLLFRSEEHVDRWSQDSGIPRGESIPLDRAWEMAQKWYAGRLEPDWQQKPVAEKQAILASVGLVSDFWALEG